MATAKGDASDNFMWFPSKSGSQIVGETTDTYFSKKGAFEVSNFSFDLKADEATEEEGSGGLAGKSKFGTFTVDKVVDSASVPLYKACCKATPFPSIMLAVRKAGGSQLLFLQYIFRANQVTGITWGGGSGEERPTEKVTFIFRAMGMQYIPQLADGREGTRQFWSWNVSDQGSSSLVVYDKDGKPIEDPPDFLSGTGK